MKHFTKALVLGLVVLAITGCGTTSNSVNSGGLIQKRKYTKGFYLNLHKRGQGSTESAKNNEQFESNRESIIKEALPSNAILVAEQLPITAKESKVQVETMLPEVVGTQQPLTNSGVSTGAEQRSSYLTGKTINDDRSILQQTVEKVKAKNELKKIADNGEGAVFLLLLIILAFILPPLAVALAEGFTTRFLLDLIFWILGISSGLLIAPWAFVFLVVSVVYALIIVLGG